MTIVPTSGTPEQERAGADDDRVEQRRRSSRRGSSRAATGADAARSCGRAWRRAPRGARSPQRRIVGPSLSRKNRLSAVMAMKKTSDARTDAPNREAVEQRPGRVGRQSSSPCPSRPSPTPRADADVREPALDGALRLVEVAGLDAARPRSRSRPRRARPDDRTRPARSPPSSTSAAPAARGNVVVREPAHERRRHGGDHRRRDHRRDDHLREREQPPTADHQQGRRRPAARR